MKNLERICGPFFTTKGVGEGTGLGLSIRHGVIAERSGRICCEMEFGKEATFIVEMSISQE